MARDIATRRAELRRDAEQHRPRLCCGRPPCSRDRSRASVITGMRTVDRAGAHVARERSRPSSSGVAVHPRRIVRNWSVFRCVVLGVWLAVLCRVGIARGQGAGGDREPIHVRVDRSATSARWSLRRSSFKTEFRRRKRHSQTVHRTGAGSPVLAVVWSTLTHIGCGRDRPSAPPRSYCGGEGCPTYETSVERDDPATCSVNDGAKIERRERLGGLLSYYYPKAA